MKVLWIFSVIKDGTCYILSLYHFDTPEPNRAPAYSFLLLGFSDLTSSREA